MTFKLSGRPKAAPKIHYAKPPWPRPPHIIASIREKVAEGTDIEELMARFKIERFEAEFFVGESHAA